MKLKSKWTYCWQKGLKGAMISDRCYIIGDKMYFTLTWGISDWEAVVLELDLTTQECRTLFKEDHIIGSIGTYEDGRFYFTSFRGNAYCIDTDGNQLWSTDIGKDNASRKTVTDGDRVYVSNYALYCLDKKTGEILWVNETYKEKSNCNIVCDDKYVYSGELGGKFFCLDKLTGKNVWDYGKDGYFRNCTLMGDGRILVSSKKEFYFFDAENGKLKKTVKAKGYLDVCPTFENGRMYVGDANDVIDSNSGNMICYELKASGLREVFSVTVGGGISTKAVIDGDRLFFAAEDNYLYCIDKNTGEELMSKKKTKGLCREIIVRGDELILLSDKGQVECFDIV